MTDRDDLIFCQTAVHNKLVSEERARECLEAVTKARQLGVTAEIEQVFLNKEYLSSTQVKAILNALGRGSNTDQPSVLGDFKVIGKLGEGSMGVVYRAQQISLGRDVALKILPPRLASDESYVSRFHREARSAAKLNHSNIIQIYAAGTEKGFHYMAMEFVDGMTALDILEKKGRLNERSAIKIMLEISHALHHAHQDGLVHRDVKPDNIMVAQNGIAKLADLGLAKEQLSAGITQAGAIIGTPHYMSPEQADATASLDGRSDVYSLGASIFHLVTGEPPFTADNVVNLIVKRQKEPARPMKSLVPSFSDGFCSIVDKCLERDTGRRYQSATEVGTDLTLLMNGQPLKFAQNSTSTVIMNQPAAASQPAPSARLEVDSKTFSLVDPDAAKGAGTVAGPRTPNTGAGSVAGPGAARRPSVTPMPTMDGGFQQESFVGSLLRPKTLKIAGSVVLAGVAIALAVMFVPPLLKSRQTVATPGSIQATVAEAESKVAASPATFVQNLEFLNKVDVAAMDEEEQRQLKQLIEQTERKARDAGSTPYKEMEAVVKTALEESRIADAIAAIEQFPKNLLIPFWKSRVDEKTAEVQSSAKAFCRDLLATLPGKIQATSPGKVLQEIEALSLEKLESYAPLEVKAISAITVPLKLKYGKLHRAHTAARKVLLAIQERMKANEWLQAIQVGADALENAELRAALAPVEGTDLFLKELQAMRDLRDGALGYLVQNVGKQIKFRGIPTTIHRFENETLVVEKQGTQSIEGKVSEFLNAKDLLRLATDAGASPETIQKNNDILLLFALDSMSQARQIKRLPEELGTGYAPELQVQIKLKQIREEMAYVPETKFPMGLTNEMAEPLLGASDSPSADALSAEMPQRTIELNAFYLAKHEVSRQQYAQFLAVAEDDRERKFAHPMEPENHSYTPRNWTSPEQDRKTATLPVSGVSWFDAYAYCSWAGYRMPTEAEWECAASWGGGEKQLFPWGGRSRYSPRMANLERQRRSGTPGPLSIDSHKDGASPWGCLNLSGNVSEWVFDWYSAYPQEKFARNPTGPMEGEEKILRGGSYLSPVEDGRTTYRLPAKPSSKVSDAGIRCASDDISLIDVRLERYGLKL